MWLTVENYDHNSSRTLAYRRGDRSGSSRAPISCKLPGGAPPTVLDSQDPVCLAGPAWGLEGGGDGSVRVFPCFFQTQQPGIPCFANALASHELHHNCIVGAGTSSLFRDQLCAISLAGRDKISPVTPKRQWQCEGADRCKGHVVMRARGSANVLRRPTRCG